ncbi:TIGR01777 family oxidoreductase [Planctomicrobium sp. SH664]|uniref:TIGR01777 family oxidoreductase n=1 Tax=Planctomicrobium sp. SH664 TaxID=3448125 RepID=UPI003F5CADCD
MRVFITGATGLVGNELVPLLKSAGHEVVKLVRRPSQGSDERTWDPQASHLPEMTLAGCEALIHLSGENVAAARWSAEQKRKIRESRVMSTQLLARAIAGMEFPPRVWVASSATGYYGDRGDELLTEESPPGTGFLSEVCREWEAATALAEDRTRVVHLRTGIVLSRQGGALKKLLLPFKLGLGGIIGDGEQYWSWIAIQDLARLFQFALEDETLRGPVNGVSPQPTTNREFTKAVGKVLSRPTIFPLPAFVARILFGEMGDALLLASARVMPAAATSHHYNFLYPDIGKALIAQGL